MAYASKQCGRAFHRRK